MVECHGSQCGFCTPGFVMSMWSSYEQHRAAGTTADAPGSWPTSCRATCAAAPATGPSSTPGSACSSCPRRSSTPRRWCGAAAAWPTARAPSTYEAAARASTRRRRWTRWPRCASALPQARLLAGSTDVGLWVNKQFRELGDIIYLGEVEELQRIDRARRRPVDRRRRLARSRLARAGAALACAHRRVAALRLAADPPCRHDGRQRRQRLADRRHARRC